MKKKQDTEIDSFYDPDFLDELSFLDELDLPHELSFLDELDLSYKHSCLDEQDLDEFFDSLDDSENFEVEDGSTEDITELNNGLWRASKSKAGCWHIVEYLGDQLTINIPSEIEGKTITGIGLDSAREAPVFFYNKMKELNIPHSIKYIKPYSIHKCENFEHINVDKNNDHFTSDDGVLFSKDLSTLIHFPSGKTRCYEVPDTTKTIGQGAFYWSRIQMLMLYSVTTVEHGAFLHTEHLIQCLLPNVETISPSAFVGCKALRSINKLDILHSSSYSAIDGALYDKSGTTLIFFPPAYKKSNVVRIPEKVKVIGSYAFANARGFKIIMPHGLEKIETMSFLYATDLELIIYGNVSHVIEESFLYTRNIKIQTNNHFVVNAVGGRVVNITEIEGEFLIKRTNGKLSYAEHQAAMPVEALEKLSDSSIHDCDNTAALKLKQRNDYLKEFPWASLHERTSIDLHRLKHLLDKELYAMDEAKMQILQWAAVTNRCDDASVSPLLLIGPAGVGKTSFGKVIAEALDKQLAFVSIPSVETAWGITGSDPAWSGARPGVIIREIVSARELPVFVLDEIDKSGAGGTYSSPVQALLAFCDDSRKRFKDQFLEVSVDLSRLFIILTANEADKVNPYLYDRCRVIELPGYTDFMTRRTILCEYIIPKLQRQFHMCEDEYMPSEKEIEEVLKHSIQPDGGVRLMERNARLLFESAIFQLQWKNTTGPICFSIEEIRRIIRETDRKTRQKAGFRVGEQE